MPEQARQELLDAAENLRASTTALTEKFQGVETFARDTRQLARWLEAAFIGLLLIVVALAITTVRANNANDKATRLGEYQVASCQATNQTRADSAQMWDFVIGLFPKDSATRTQLQDKVNATYKQRDCTKVVQGKVK